MAWVRHHVLAKEHAVDELVDRVSTQILIVDLAIFGGVDPNELPTPLILFACFFDNGAVFDHGKPSEQLSLICWVIIRKNIGKLLNNRLELRTWNMVGHPNIRFVLDRWKVTHLGEL